MLDFLAMVAARAVVMLIESLVTWLVQAIYTNAFRQPAAAAPAFA
jgi:hypothetical protein